MDLVLIGGLAAAGYYINKDGKNKRRVIDADLEENVREPISYNIYEGNNVEKVTKAVQKKADNVWEKSMNPIETNIIPADFNAGYWASPFEDRPATDRIETKRGSGDVEPMANMVQNQPGDMTHNNMVPFFGGTIKQNTDIGQNSKTLDLFTGSQNLRPPKQEVENMFEPEQNVHFVNGVVEERDVTRFVPSITQEGIRPFQPINVGRGLNQGATSTPTGGFHDTYRPPQRTVDELRAATNPKQTYAGRLLPAKNIGTYRGKVGDVAQNRPARFYKQTQDMLLKTTGAVTKQKQRPKVVLKYTNRKTSKPYSGIAGPARKKKEEYRSIVQKDRRNTLCAPGMRNLAADRQWTVKGKYADPSDYGKSSFRSYPNERQNTGTRTHISNLKSVTENASQRMEDKARTTRKEKYVNYTRRGNVKLRGAKQHQLQYVDQARKTIKETLIHDNNPSNLRAMGTQSHQMYNKLDLPRTTIKETTVHDTRTGNVNLNKKTQAYNKEEWKLRPTLRQVNPNNKWGCCVDSKPSLSGPQKVTAFPNDVAKVTVKQTTQDSKRSGNLSGKGGVTKQIVYDPNDTAKVTVRETTEDRKYLATPNSGVMQNGGGYIAASAGTTAPETNRQTTSDIDYYGVPDADNQGGGAGYLTNEHVALETNRQTTSDNDYTGGANASVSAPISYESVYNATMNALKEEVAKGRAPTNSSVKVVSGAETMNVEDKNVSVIENMRVPAPDKTYAETATALANTCTITKDSNNESRDQTVRIDPELLKAHRENPYTHSLNSAV